MDFLGNAAVLATTLFAATSVAIAAGQQTEAPKEPGVMLRDGGWDGGVGSYEIPLTLQNVKPSAWPGDGWFRLSVEADHIQVVQAPMNKGPQPDFLRAITKQVQDAQSGTSDEAPAQTEGEPANYLYLRVPGTQLSEGSFPVYLFKNRTSRLFPKLDYRYELSFKGQPFAFTVQNGLRGKNGAPYGDGAHYRVEYDGQVYEYDLGGFGWSSSIVAIVDLDGDGKPDFIIDVDGNNSGVEAVLLSSKAKPGKNPPTASLVSTGC